MPKALNAKQRLFVKHYLLTKNATQSAIDSGYSKKTAASIGAENLRKPQIMKTIEDGVKSQEARVEKKIENKIMTHSEWLQEINALASCDIASLYTHSENGKLRMSLLEIKERGLGRLIKKMKILPDGRAEFELWNKQHALELLGKAQRWISDIQITPPAETPEEDDFEAVFNDPELAKLMLKAATVTSTPASKKAKGEAQ